MPKPVDTTERLFNLILLLKTTQDWLTLEDICNELQPRYPESRGAARQAFERDKKSIGAMGIVIDKVTLAGHQAGQMGYRIDPKKNELPNLNLSDDEESVLRFALGALSIEGSLKDGALVKLTGDGFSADSSVSGSMVIDLHAPLAILPVVTDAAATRTELVITYAGKKRTIQPYGVLARSGHWYVIANDPAKGELRRFRLDRLEKPTTVGGPGAFVRPDGFVLRDQLPHDPKVINEDPEARDDFAVVRVNKELASGVERELGPSSIVKRDPNGDVTFNVPCANRWAFRSWLLGMVDRAEVLEPAAVRSEVIDWLKGVDHG